MLGSNVSKYEWAKAKAHAKFPGPGHPVPVKPKYRRKRFEDAVIQEFLEWLHSHDFLQNLSFGQKVVRLKNGVHTAIEAVKLTSSQTKIIQDYSKTFVDQVQVTKMKFTTQILLITKDAKHFAQNRKSNASKTKTTMNNMATLRRAA